MNREECLDWLYRLRGEIYVYIQPKEWLIPMNNALDVAIKALSQEPCEDVISRQAAIDAIWDGVNMDIYTREVKECLEKLPSVSTEKTGWWKRISIDKYSEHAKYWYRCDRCGKDNLGNTDWCPNCGAKMEVEE